MNNRTQIFSRGMLTSDCVDEEREPDADHTGILVSPISCSQEEHQTD